MSGHCVPGRYNSSYARRQKRRYGNEADSLSYLGAAPQAATTAVMPGDRKEGMAMKLEACRIWVLRPRPLQQQLCQAIGKLGGEAVMLPMLDIKNIPLPRSVFPDNSRIVFVSRNAVRAVAEHATLLRTTQLYAAGDGTAAELRQLGCEYIVSAGASGGSEALLARPELDMARVKGTDWLVVCGDNSREILANTLSERGARVQLAVAYKSEPMQYDSKYMEKMWTQSPGVIAVYSVAEIQQLLKLSPAEARPRLVTTPLAVLSERIKEKAMEQGFRNIAVAAETSDDGCLGAIITAAASE